MNAQDKKKLDGYFGFCQRKRDIHVGLKLEEELEKKKIYLLLLTKECSKKNEELYREKASDSPLTILYRYEGDYPIALACGYEKLNAVGLSDPHLANAILDILKADKE